METTTPTLLIVGNDSRLDYLIQRYAERSGFKISTLTTTPAAKEAVKVNAAAVIFLTIEQLETAQEFSSQLAAQEIAILACASPADAARARELGAEDCLLHPVTYDDFHNVLTTLTKSRQVSSKTTKESGF